MSRRAEKELGVDGQVPRVAAAVGLCQERAAVRQREAGPDHHGRLPARRCDTAKAAKTNPDQKFAIVDYAYPDCCPGAVVGKDCGSDKALDNVLGLTFATDEAAFLAGYAAAATTKTGKVGTFGGIKLPTVTIFMKGYEAGVKYHNQTKGTNVEVVGWDTAKNDGVFVGNFDSLDDGRKIAESMMDEGADIIMPVAGPVGLGSAAACKEKGCMIVGVDTDQYVSAPEYKDIYLTSVMKNMDVAVFNAIKAVKDGSFKGGTYLGTLKDDGVGIAPFHDFESKVPADPARRTRHAASRTIIDGKIKIDDVLAGTATAPVAADLKKITVGQVTDMGGIDDKSFNATAWEGVQDAEKEFGAAGKYLESQQQADYAKNVQQFVSEKLDLIVTVGFLLGVRHGQGGAGQPRPEVRHRRLRLPGLLSGCGRRQGLRLGQGTGQRPRPDLRHRRGRLPGRLCGRGHHQDRQGRHLRRHQASPPSPSS